MTDHPPMWRHWSGTVACGRHSSGAGPGDFVMVPGLLAQDQGLRCAQCDYEARERLARLRAPQPEPAGE